MLNGQIALVTGASRGIGKAIALELGKHGATVFGTATSQDGAAQIGAYLVEAGIKGEGLVLEVREAAQVDAVLSQIEKQYGPLTILVNNAGATRDNLLLRMKEEEWATIIDTDLSSVYRLSKAVLRGMMKVQRGRIINIASVVGVTGSAGQANYAAAKAGVLGFTKSLAREVGSRNITINAVAPGWIETDMTRNLPEAQRRALLETIPLQRPGEPQEVAKVVAFLASADASYITGETVHVNGGMYMA